MKHLLRSCTLAALTLVGGAAAHGQTNTIYNGSMTLSFSAYLTDLLQAQGATVSFSNYSASGFKVKGGSVDAATGAAEVQSLSRIVFKADGVQVILEDLEVDASSGSATISAELKVNGVDEGRYAIFQIVSAGSVSAEAIGRHKEEATVQNVQFTVNPEFAGELNEMFQFASFDASQVLGTIALDVKFKS